VQASLDHIWNTLQMSCIWLGRCIPCLKGNPGLCHSQQQRLAAVRLHKQRGWFRHTVHGNKCMLSFNYVQMHATSLLLPCLHGCCSACSSPFGCARTRLISAQLDVVTNLPQHCELRTFQALQEDSHTLVSFRATAPVLWEW
jgi:hypothetical protein